VVVCDAVAVPSSSLTGRPLPSCESNAQIQHTVSGLPHRPGAVRPSAETSKQAWAMDLIATEMKELNTTGAGLWPL